ncbi:MAG: hypothetical protein Q8N88_06640 [Nanoarchaeota archaeon]|nr:hypothetical protein [Nanoarchaeota archaeon]
MKIKPTRTISGVTPVAVMLPPSRIMRIMREIPSAYLIAGLNDLDLRKEIEDEIRKNKLKINEIRFREIGFALRDKRKVDQDLKLKITKYTASNGTEFFLEIVNKDDILFGLLRLRLEKDKTLPATIRELHVYCQSLSIGQKSTTEIQHKGLGKKLLETAEKITRKK